VSLRRRWMVQTALVAAALGFARCWYDVPDLADGGTSDAAIDAPSTDGAQPIDGAPPVDGSPPPIGFLACGIAGGLCPLDGGTNDADEMLENLCCADGPDAASICGPITGACMSGRVRRDGVLFFRRAGAADVLPDLPRDPPVPVVPVIERVPGGDVRRMDLRRRNRHRNLRRSWP
jgi:hypothetical protein